MNIQTDNEILAIVTSMDKDKTVDYRSDLPDFGMDIALNWNNTPANEYQNRLAAIAEDLNGYRKNGFTDKEAREILIAKGHNDDEVLRIIAESNPDETMREKKVAKKYEDLSKRVERLAEDVKPSEFIDIITAKKNAMNGIVRVADRDERELTASLREVWVRKDTGTSRTAMAHNCVHNIVKPFVEEEILRSNLEANLKRDRVVISSAKKANTFTVVDGEDIHVVDMEKIACTCDRAKSGNFDRIGLPCEHIVLVHEYLGE